MTYDEGAWELGPGEQPAPSCALLSALLPLLPGLRQLSLRGMEVQGVGAVGHLSALSQVGGCE